MRASKVDQYSCPNSKDILFRLFAKKNCYHSWSPSTKQEWAIVIELIQRICYNCIHLRRNNLSYMPVEIPKYSIYPKYS